MTDKTEWELVDDPASEARQAHRQAHEQAFRQTHGQQQAGQSGRDTDGRAAMARAILGPHWKFKLAGMAALALAVVILAIMLTGIVFLVVSGVALLSFGITRLRRMLHGGRRKPAAYPFPVRRRQDEEPWN